VTGQSKRLGSYMSQKGYVNLCSLHDPIVIRRMYAICFFFGSINRLIFISAGYKENESRGSDRRAC